jgi:hypothetical protein
MRRTLVFLLLVFVCSARAASAQADGRLSVLVGATAGSGTRISPMIAAAVGSRLTPHFGFELEAGFLPHVDFADRSFDFPIPLALRDDLLGAGLSIFPLPSRIEREGHITTFLANTVGEFDTRVRWLRFHVVAGGGVASVVEATKVDFSRPVILAGGSLPSSLIDPTPSETERTELALQTGVGAQFRAWERTSIGVEARYLHIAGSGDAADGVRGSLNLVRVSGRITVPF